MRRHLYGRKEPCQAKLAHIAAIELTDSVKDEVLANRIYRHPPPPPPPPQPEPTPAPTPTQSVTQTTINTINNYNMINNMVVSMDLLTKLKHLYDFRKTDQIPFHDKVETLYDDKGQRLMTENDDVLTYTSTNILDMIFELTKAKKKNLADFNVYYDKGTNCVRIFMGSKWEGHLHDRGAREIIDIFVSTYLDMYEVYLIRRLTLQHDVAQDQARFRESLENYYRFTSVFEIPPYVRDKNDTMIMHNEDDDNYDENADAFEIVDRYNDIYRRCKESVSQAQKKELYKQVLDIIKSSTKINMIELNKRVMDLIQVNKEFKTALIDARIGS
jgi:hypothetical protein